MNECCEALENREPGPGPRGGEYADDVVVTHCVVCECRHIEIVAEPLEVGAEGASL